MKRPLLFLAIAAGFVAPVNDAFAQNDYTTFNWKFEEANKLMDEKFYDKAAEIWGELVESNPENSNLNWKLGVAYFESFTQRDKSLPFLEKAADRRHSEYSLANISDYDKYDPKERNAPPEVDYYLARSYHLNYELDKAELYYQKFLDQRDFKHDLYKPAQRGIQQVGNARELIKDPKHFPVQNIGGVVNGNFPDFSPVVSLDGNSLFFTSRRVRPDSSNNGVIDEIAGFPYEDIYVSYKDREGNWQKPELLNINNEGHLASINVAADGQRLFMYRDDEGDGNIYQSRLIGEQWSEPEKLGSNINTKSWETHAALTADESTMYFVSDRTDGSLGGRDIYRVVRLPNGEWSKAQGIGGVINTPYDEDAPFVHPDGKTLFFASKGHNSMGGFDIFYSEKDENGIWGIPKNLGYPMNTVDDDVFFVTTADGRSGYFSSNKDGGYGEKDIYRVELPVDMEASGLTVLKGFIVPPSGQPLPSNTLLYVTDRETGETKTYRPRARDGVYVVILPPCKEYNLDYRVNDQTVHTEDVYVECETAYQEINKEIYLNPVTLTAPAEVKDLPYDPTIPEIPSTVSESPVVNRTPAVVETPVVPPPTETGSGAGSTTERVGTISAVTPKDEPAVEEKPMVDIPAVGGKPKAVTAVTPRDVERSKSEASGIRPGVKYEAEYTKYYGYNMTDINMQDSDWKKFIADIGSIIETNGSANLILEASASKVPTTTFASNELLSKTRMEDARGRLIESLRGSGIDPDKVYISVIGHDVTGPNYRGDYGNTKKYEKFQYVKLRAN